MQAAFPSSTSAHIPIGKLFQTEVIPCWYWKPQTILSSLAEHTSPYTDEDQDV